MRFTALLALAVTLIAGTLISEAARPNALAKAATSSSDDCHKKREKDRQKCLDRERSNSNDNRNSNSNNSNAKAPVLGLTGKLGGKIRHVDFYGGVAPEEEDEEDGRPRMARINQQPTTKKGRRAKRDEIGTTVMAEISGRRKSSP